MAAVPRAWVDGFADSLEVVADGMGARLAEELARVDYDRPVAEVRETLIAIMKPYCMESRLLAARVAAEFYDGLRERMVGERMGAELIDGYEDEAVERRVRSAIEPLAAAQRLDDGSDAQGVAEAVAGAAETVSRALVDYQGYGIKAAAGGTVYGNGARDTRGVMFARIPRGSKSYPNGCPFCQMLASRGFVYYSRLTAGGLDPNHYHSDCQCMVVPSWGKGSVEGYDPSDYQKGYQEWLDG